MNILIELFKFYFDSLDALLGRPDSLEAMIVIFIFSMFLFAGTLSIAIAAVLPFLPWRFIGDAIYLALVWTPRAVRNVRNIAPLWAWVVIGFVMYHLGMLFGEVIPQYKTLVGGIYGITFAGMMLTGIWAAKQRQEIGERVILGFIGTMFLSTCLSALVFPWAAAPGAGIFTVFWGLLGMTIQATIEACRRQYCHCR